MLLLNVLEAVKNDVLKVRLSHAEQEGDGVIEDLIRFTAVKKIHLNDIAAESR